MHEDRRRVLKQLHRCLNGPDGLELMAELKSQWYERSALGKTEQETAYRVGQLDAWRLMQQLQSGELLHDRQS